MVACTRKVLFPGFVSHPLAYSLLRTALCSLQYLPGVHAAVVYSAMQYCRNYTEFEPSSIPFLPTSRTK